MIAWARSGVEWARTTSSKVLFMSSIIASSEPPAESSTPFTGRGVLSSASSPIDWASRRAGSIVSTTTCRPCSAARSPSAAAVVVLPTPPEPQQTTTRVRRSPITSSRSQAGSHQAAPWEQSSSASS